MIATGERAAVEFTIPNELQKLQKRASQFTHEQLLPLEGLVLRRELPEGELPRQHRQPLEGQARELGLWAVEVPTEAGGQGLGFLARCLVEEELNQTATLFRPGDENATLLLAGNETQQQNYLAPLVEGRKRSCWALAEPTAGSDWHALQTRAQLRDQGYVIDGEKWPVEGADEADFVVAFAVAEEGVTAFLVDRETPGLELSQAAELLGGGYAHALRFRGCTASTSQVLGKVGHGARLAYQHLQYMSPVVSARCLGMGQRCLNLALERLHVPAGQGRPPAEYQAVQWMVAESAMDLHSARTIVHAVAWKIDQGLELGHEPSVVKVFAAEAADRVADRALQLCGGLGATRELPVELFYRRVRLGRLVEGSSETHRSIVAQSLLGRLEALG